MTHTSLRVTLKQVFKVLRVALLSTKRSVGFFSYKNFEQKNWLYKFDKQILDVKGSKLSESLKIRDEIHCASTAFKQAMSTWVSPPSF